MFYQKLSSFLIIFYFAVSTGFGQQIPTPKDHFGFNIGDNYQLANFTQTEAYFKKLAVASPRARYTVIGKTEEGRDQFMLIVTSPENQKNLEAYKQISQKMGNADITIDQAKEFAKNGKAVVWIDGGLHANEVVGIHQLIETAYQLLSRTDDETVRILNDVIILMTHANPDGQELQSNWYMREPKPEKRSLSNLPGLYEKYAGHDNNRDFYMLNLKESQNIGRQLFVEWIPQIMYNHHQAGPAGSIVAGAPYRDPFNYVFDPLIITGLDAVGAAMQNRLNAEAKPGYTSKAGSVFSTWYNGGLRTTTYFHNMIGLLTEIVGSPNPSTIPLVTSRLIPNAATPNPIVPQKWLFRQSIDYSVSLNYAVLNYASRNRDELLMNIYQMGKNAIDKGNTDTWSLSPSKIAAMEKLHQDSLKRVRPAAEPGRGNTGTVPLKFYDSVMKNIAFKDPRGYIIPSDQPDFATAVEFLNALIKTGVVIQKATADFTVAGKKYPANSYIIKTNQAFRPHVLDMFEPQDHPNDFQYPGGPPVPPYDAAGWTLAYQMGVEFDRIMDGFEGPFEKNPAGQIIKLSGVGVKNSATGYVLDARANQSYKAINNLINGGADVYRMNNTNAEPAYSSGSFYIAAGAKTKSAIDKIAAENNVQFIAVNQKPAALTKIKKARIALWDTYGGSMPSGWVRLILEKFDYAFDVIYPKDIDTGNLRSKYDVIVFVGGAIPAVGGNTNANAGFGFNNPNPDSIPAEFRNRLGRITAARSIPQLKLFMEAGGNIVTIGSSTQLAYHLKLPVSNAMVEIVNGEEKMLGRDKFYTPGSILQMMVDNNQPATSGSNKLTDIYFDNSPVFKLSPDAVSSSIIKPLAWFGTDKILRSGWSWGETYLKNGITAFEAKVGNGKLYAFTPEITFRAQSWGTFKFLFNQLYSN
ncbi:MAG: peptidase [Chitinophagaceae bacterium]|nr:peptidase [Chitinophagaceae bacterium]